MMREWRLDVRFKSASRRWWVLFIVSAVFVVLGAGLMVVQVSAWLWLPLLVIGGLSYVFSVVGPDCGEPMHRTVDEQWEAHRCSNCGVDHTGERCYE